MRPRLLEIAKMIDKDASVLDVGTDHGYLPIYLSKNKLCKKVLASDISKKALYSAKKHIQQAGIDDINLYLSDGLKKIDEYFDTLVISGMGTHTIIDILQSGKLPDNLILSSNNDLYLLRKYLNEIGYKLKEEKDVLDRGKYYVINSYTKGNETLSQQQLEYGKDLSNDYYKYLYNAKKDLLKKVNFKTRFKLKKELKKLKKLI